jgi:hypothetical protein
MRLVATLGLLALVAVLGPTGLAGCWRGGDSSEPALPSFIARRNAIAELHRNADAIPPQLEYTMQRIIGLASEAEREAIRTDLAAIEGEVARLSRYATDRRAQGDSIAALDAIERKLERAALAIVQLREELLYAKTTAELAALDELSRTQVQEGDDERRQLLLVRLRGLVRESNEPVQLVDPSRRVRNAVRIEVP